MSTLALEVPKMRSTDAMLTRYTAEIEERQAFIDGLVQSAQEKGEDLSDDSLELVTRARDRIAKVNELMAPLEEARRISAESSDRIQALARFMGDDENKPKEVRYRSAGEYVSDRWRAGLEQEDARNRLEMYHRAAAHQTSADTEGLLPEPVLGPVINWIDESRPLVNALGPRQLPAGTWSRPRITQHTNVEAQSAEKAELTSQKM